MFKFKALNEIAVNHMGKALLALDQRHKFDLDVVLDVLAEAFGQSHQSVIKILGQADICDALVKGEVLSRVSMRSEFAVRPAWIEIDATWETVDNDPDFRSPPRSKSHCFYRTADSAKTLTWDDVAGLGHGPGQYFEIVNFHETTGAFVAGVTPSVRFLDCSHAPDPETSEAFMKVFRGAMVANGVGMAELQTGMVVSDAHRALGVLNATTNRFFNGSSRRYCVLTRDKFAREEKSWGQYHG
jgi:hypothetical protein